MLSYGGEQLLGVRHRRDHLEAALGQQPRQPVAQQHRVLGDHDSHGSSTPMTVGPPGGLSIVSVPSTAAARCASPASPVPSPAPMAAPPRPLSVTLIRSTSPARVASTS